MLKRSLCLALIALLLAAALPVGLAARAEKGGAMYANLAAVKVYKKPNLSGKTIKTVWYGEEVAVAAFTKQGDVAALIDRKGRTGYCDANALTKKNPNTYDITVYAQKKKTPVYAGCSVKSKKLEKLKRNATATMIAVSLDGWIRVKYGGRYGYMRLCDVDDAPYSEGQLAWCRYDGTASVMSSAQGWDDVGMLRLGDEVRLLGKKDGWTKIRNDKGEIGWIDGDCVTTKNPVLNQTVYAQVSDKILARQPGGSAGLKIHKKLKKGARMTLVTKGDFWARVKYKGKTYFTPAIYLSTEKAPKTGRIVVTVRKCDMQDTPAIAGHVIAQLPKGTKLRLLAGGPLCAKVDTVEPVNGRLLTGWVLATQLAAD